MTDNCTRTLTIDRAHSKAGDTFPCTLSTETPYLREYGWEVLDHSRVDLSRAPLPLIESHDASQLNIGIVDGLHVDGGKLRGTIRLGKSARAKELAADIKEGIVRNVSIGYEVSDGEQVGERDGEPIYRFAFLPHELSLVAAGADINAGIYRSSKGKKNMTTEKLSRSERKREGSQEHDDIQRVNAIRSMAEAHDMPDLGKQAIAGGWTYEDFNRKALEKLGERNNSARSESSPDYGSTHGQTPNHYMGMGMPCDNSQYGRALENYSLTRLLRGLADPKALDDCGLELEISKDMQNVLGKRSKGILVPFEALEQQRAITVGGSGSNLVPEDHLAGSFIDVLRNSSHVMNLRPNVLRGLVGDVDIPRKTAGASAYWLAGDGSDAITESTPTFDTVSLTPKTVGGAVTFSHKLIVQSSPDVERIVRQDLADLIASEIDIKAIAGSGASNQPTGILNTSGIGAVDFVADAPTYAEVLAMETALANANADRGNLAWLMDPDMAEALKTTPKQGSGVEGNFIWNDAGMVAGIPAHRTANMTSGYMVLGNWQHLLVGFWGGIEIDADPYGTNFLKGSVTVRVLADIDIGVRHPGAFCEGHNAP